MIAVDTNVLVAAFMPDHARHRQAREAVTGLVTIARPWGIPWSVVHEFLVVSTQPRIWREPAWPSEALAAIGAWAGHPTCRLLGEGPGYLERLADLLDGDDVRASRIFDARIAATCLVHGVDELWTADRDFSRFPALRTRNPLV